jgi:hypothetical protein
MVVLGESDSRRVLRLVSEGTAVLSNSRVVCNAR